MYAACMRRVRRLPRHGGQAGMYAAYMRGAAASVPACIPLICARRAMPAPARRTASVYPPPLTRAGDATLPCPAGQGALPVCAFDAVCPAGKGAAEWRAVFWCVAEKTGFRCVLPIRKLPPARWGTGERASPRKGRSFSRTPSAPRSPNEPFPARNGDTPHLTDETSPLLLQNLPLYPSAANAALYKPRLIAPAFCGEHRARAQAQLSAPAKGYLSTLPATSSPVIPPPQTPQADGPCSWAVRRVCALPPEQKRNEAPMPPTRGAWAREHGANGTGRRHCRPAG